MNGRDLGTYYAKVYYEDGKSYIMRYHTGRGTRAELRMSARLTPTAFSPHGTTKTI